MPQFQLGFNLSGLGSDSCPQRPFLNLVRFGQGWNGNKHSGGTLNSWIDGYNHFDIDTHAELFTMNDPTGGFYDEMWFALFTDGHTNYAGKTSPPLGTYILLHDGGNGAVWSWNFTSFTYKSGGYTGGAVAKTRIVLDLPSLSNQCRMKLTSLGTTRPTNIKLVYEPNRTFTQVAGAAYDPTVGTRSDYPYVGDREWSVMHDGEIFDPDFIDMLKPPSSNEVFSPLRFMDWNYTNGNTSTSYSERNPTDWLFWNDISFAGGASHCAYEVMVALCNKVGADGWFNIPPLADDAYYTDIANHILNGSSGVPDGFGVTWAGLNSNLLAYMEQSNEIWNDSIHGGFANKVWVHGAQICASIFPNKANEIGQFTGFIDDGSGAGTPPAKSPAAAGHPGTVLSINAVTSGHINVPGDNNNIITDYPGHTITDYTRVVSGTNGGGVGTYGVNISQQTGSITIRQGFVNNMSKLQQLWQGCRGTWIWRAILGSQARCIKGSQFTGFLDNGDDLQTLPSAYGSGVSTWDGVHGGACYVQYKVNAGDGVAIAPYFDFNSSLPPAAWTDSAVDTNYQLFKQEMINGGVLPLSNAFVTATDLGGGALATNWTQCKVTSGQGLADPPPNGSIVCVKFTAATTAANPTISVDGGTQLQIQGNLDGGAVFDNTFGSQGIAVTTRNLIYTRVTRTQNPVSTPGWRTFNTGFSSAGNSGFLAISTYLFTKRAFDSAHATFGDIPIVFYEGGPSFYGNFEPWLTYLKELHRSQAMGDVCTAYLSQLNSFGYVSGNMFEWFASCDFYTSQNGNFAAKEFIEDPPSGSPKYMAMVNYISQIDTISPFAKDFIISKFAPIRTVFIPPTKKSVKIHGPHYRGGLN